MVRALTRSLLGLSLLAGMASGGTGMLLALQCCADDAPRSKLLGASLLVTSLGLIVMPLSAWLLVPRSRRRLRLLLCVLSLGCSSFLLHLLVSLALDRGL